MYCIELQRVYYVYYNIGESVNEKNYFGYKLVDFSIQIV